MKTLLTLLCFALTAFITSTHAADHAEFTKRMEFVRIGDSEERVLKLLDRAPDRVQRSNVLGVQKAVLEFDAGSASHELVFYAGHLTAKTMRSRKPSFVDRLLWRHAPGGGVTAITFAAHPLPRNAA